MAQKLTTNFTAAATRSNSNKLMGGGKTLHVSLQRSLLRQGSIMFAVLLSVLVNVGWGQNYTPVEYDLIDQPFENLDDNVLLDGSTNSSNRLFSYMAANGYGQWTVNANTGVPKWMLLSNSSTDPNATSNLPIPHGIVAHGNFNNILDEQVKVATNLQGSVRYVWYDITNQKFVVEGFNDQSFAGTDPDEKQINISLHTLPKPQLNRCIIKKGIHSYLDIPVAGLIKGIAEDPNWKDEFDIAMDRKYLYLVYRVYNPLNIVQPFTISAKAIDLISGQVVQTFPIGIGFRPTVACDVRNNPEDPTFDIGYLDPFLADNNDWFGFNIKHLEILNGVSFQSVILPKFVKRPIQPATGYDVNNIGVFPYGVPIYHIRIIVSSKDGGHLTPPAKSMYILKYIEGPARKAELYYHKYSNLLLKWEDNATYVDGPLIISPRGGPIQEGLFYTVVNDPIIAFANPYDGKRDNDDFIEFHCLYRLWNDLPSVPANQFTPLLMVREDHNGILDVLEQDTRTILTRNHLGVGVPAPLHDGDYYCGAANQMGIHVRWSSYNTSTERFQTYYTRDKRKFDEDIEENTLVTYDTYIGDGTTHLGTPGAKLLPGRTLTMWTDPFFGVSTDGIGQNSGLYIAPVGVAKGYHNGQLIFKDDNTLLKIGNDNASSGEKATLISMPNFEIRYGHDWTNKGQKVIINPHSTWEHYGIQPGGSTHYKSNILGNGIVELKPSSKLNIHGGSVFTVPDFSTLNGDNAHIEFMKEPSIIPVFPKPSTDDPITGKNPIAHGSMNVHGTINLDGCLVTGNLASEEIQGVIKVTSNLYGYTTLPAQQATFTNTDFSAYTTLTGPDVGMWDMRINFLNAGSFLYGYRKVTIDDCSFLGTTVFSKDHGSDFEVYSSTFDRFQQTPALSFEWTKTTAPTSYLLIGGNTITMNGNKYLSSFDFAGGILLSGFKFERTLTNDMNLISDNTIRGIGWISTVSKGVHLINSTASLMSNHIEGEDPNSMEIGILLENQGIDVYINNSFFCSNLVLGCHQYGMDLEKWTGYAKFNTVFSCGDGVMARENTLAKLLYNTVYENTFSGIRTSHSSSEVYMTSISDQQSNHTPAYNLVYSNNIFESPTSGQIKLQTESKLYLGTSSMSESVIDDWGHNSIVSNSEDDNLIYAPSSTEIFNMNQNLFGYGADIDNITATINLTGGSNSLYMPNISFSTPSNPLELSAVESYSGQVVCDNGIDPIVKKNRQAPQSITESADSIECEQLRQDGNNLFDQFQFQKSYDTLKFYIENCYANKDSWRAFTTLIAATGGLASGQYAWEPFREWLKSVLYLNPTDSNYYCSDVQAILSTFNYFNDERGYDINGAMAVINYLIENSKCQSWSMVYDAEKNRIYSRQKQLEKWRDTVMDSIKTPLDTTVPTLEDLGLGILRGPSSTISPATHEPHLGELIATRNPFTDILELKYRLSKSGMVRIDVYDLLGRAVYAEGQGYKQDGEYVLSLQAKSWSPGSYYVRLSTPNGEVKTVKVVKE